MEEKLCIFTGHRTIPHSKYAALEQVLAQQITLLAEHGILRFGSGGALGFDTLAAETVLTLRREMPKIRLSLFLPCREQARYWSAENQMRHARLRRLADEVVFTGDAYTQQCMYVRNRFMVDRAHLCLAFLEKERGGTAYTVNYAKRRGLAVINLNDQIPPAEYELPQPQVK